jgi:hypothetical protein
MIMNNIYIGRTKSIGMGLFASTRFRKGQILFALEGNIIIDSYGPDYRIGARWIAIDDKTWLSPSKNNCGFYINHSCKPNSVLKNKIEIAALANIEKGEEITIDYSTIEADPYWKMKCKCGNRNCRKLIRSIQFLPEGVYKEYESFLPEFMRRARVGIYG